MFNKATSILTVLLLGVLMFAAVQTADAQSTEISGVVTDQATGETLPGASVVLAGTSTGTSTDMEGRYSLTVPSLDGTLIFSSVGFQTLEIPIDGQTTINASLSVLVLSGGELVVVGYGTQERRQITGSVSSIQEEGFVTGNVRDVADMIQGKVPGLQIAQGQGGNPNASQTIRLRGISSFGANQEPLVVVDGIIGATLDSVDPNDIASVDVLKDASASAIYGTRGSAGVILITTKSGRSGEDLSVSYNAYTTIETVENRNEVLSADEYRSFSQQVGISIQDFGANTDWFDEVSQTGSNNVHSLAVSGGTENMNYRLSGNYRDREGIQKYTGSEQIGARLNLSHWALDRKLKLTSNVAVTNRDEALGHSDAYKFVQIFNPTAPVRADGFENLGGYFDQNLFDYKNPVNMIETATRDREIRSYNVSLRADYDFNDVIPNLSASAFYSLDNRSVKQQNFYSRTNNQFGGATQAALGPGSASQSLVDTQSELFEATANYIADLTQRLTFESFVGYSYNQTTNDGFSAAGGDFVTDAVGVNNFQFAQDFNQGLGSVNSFRNENKIIGVFGRANINFDQTYFLNASIRREGSSRFGADNKWGNFWALGAGVDIANLVDLGFFEVLRARVSMGKTGQDAPFSGISIQQFAPQGNFFVDGRFIQSFGPISNANPDLKWEEKTELNVGVDFEMLENRLRGSAEYYNSITSDLLFSVGVPVPPNLFGQTWRNVGEIENSGVEISLAYDALQSVTSGVNWTTQLNLTLFGETMLNKFESDEVRLLATAGSPGQNSTTLIRIKEGEPIGQIWGPQFSRIGEQGQWLYLNQDGNEVGFGALTPDDRRVLGNGLPGFQLGWSNNINVGNFDMSMFFRGVFGHQLVNLPSLFYQAPAQMSSYNVLKTAMDIPELTASPQFSSFQVEDADFVRLQNLSVGYTVPLNSEMINRLRVYVSGNNLFTITGYSGINPEVRHTDINPGEINQGFTLGGALAPGIERRPNWFTTRSVNIGINLDF